jgi:hypothetical protein
MNKPLFEIADILRKGFGNYNHAFSPLPPDHYKVANALMACRTSALGGHIDKCDHCSHERISYNSCRNRISCYQNALPSAVSRMFRNARMRIFSFGFWPNETFNRLRRLRSTVRNARRSCA